MISTLHGISISALYLMEKRIKNEFIKVTNNKAAKCEMTHLTAYF